MAHTSTSTALRSLGLRLWRIGMLVAVVLLLRSTQTFQPLSLKRVRDFFPTAASIDAGDPQAVRDASGVIVGQVTQTSPQADDLIGYAGPSNMLIVMDARGVVTGLRLLHSDDTAEHVAEIVGKREFFRQFHGLQLGKLEPKQLDAVTGATLTSSAITEGVLRKLGRQGPSLRFPEAITLEEVKALEPHAASLQTHNGTLQVLDAGGKVIARAVRTAPVSDAIIGYKGPSDTLLLLDPNGSTVRAVQLRKSYDTKRYVGYVTGDSYFLNLFKGMAVEKLADLDFNAAKIEGVSGATETSWAMAESLKRRAQELVTEAHPGWAMLRSIRWRWQDTGHALVLLSALVMAFTSLRGNSLARTLHHLLLVLYVGFIAGELLSQALFAGWAQHGVPWRVAPGLVLTGLIALLAPVVSRRQLYCHHICPHGAAQQLLMKNLRWQWQPPKWLEGLPFALLAAVLFIVALGWGVNLNGLEPFDAYVWKIAGVASIAIAVLGLIASMFVPMAYCRYGCPTGALFKLLRFAGDNDRLARKEWICAALIAALAAWRWLHGW